MYHYNIKTIFVTVVLCLNVLCAFCQENTESITATFNFDTSEPYGLQSTGSSYLKESKSFKQKDITVTLKDQTAIYLGANKYLRLCNTNPTGKIQIQVPDPYNIISIEFVAHPQKEGINSLCNDKDKESLSSKQGKSCTWKNNSSNIIRDITFTPKVIKNTDNSFISSFNVTYTRTKPDAILDEKGTDTEQAVKDNVNSTHIEIKRIFSNNFLNTVCLPFNLTVEKIKEIFGEGSVVYTYEGVSGDEIVFNSNIGSVIPAGTPFLLKPEIYVENPVFKDILVESTNPQSVTYGSISLCGSYAPYTMCTDGTELFLNSSGSLIRPKEGSNIMRGFRCYFKREGNEAKIPNTLFDGKSTDGISELSLPHSIEEPLGIRDIYGNRFSVPTKLLQQGLYILPNGRKIIIK